MNRLTLQLLTLTIAIIAFAATDAVAQKRITLDSSGKATISATIKPFTPGNFVENGQFLALSSEI